MRKGKRAGGIKIGIGIIVVGTWETYDRGARLGDDYLRQVKKRMSPSVGVVGGRPYAYACAFWHFSLAQGRSLKCLIVKQTFA